MATCSVVGHACSAPAGYRVGGLGYAPGKSVRLPKCYTCGQAVCSNCSLRVGRSVVCAQCCEDHAAHVLG